MSREYREAQMSQGTSLKSLILVPSVITLAVTLLRLIGELQDWSPLLFGKAAGGGGSIVGIAWLVPIFGAWFGWKLARAGSGPGGIGRALGLTVLALLVVPLLGFLGTLAKLDPNGFAFFGIIVAGSIVAIWVALRAWPALGRTLFGYGLAARIPVVLVMLVAILGNWGTHYDVAPSPDFPAMSPLAKWFAIGLLPQLTIWIAYTVVIGALFGLVAAALGGRRAAATA